VIANMNAGKAVRFNRLVAQDGKTFIAALDHGIAGLSPLESLANPQWLITDLANVGVDALIVTPGMLRRFSDLFRRLGIIVRVDCGPTAATGLWSENRPAVSADDALRLGADAVVAMGIVGAEGESESLHSLAKLAVECDRSGILLVAEMLPGGFASGQPNADQIRTAARVGADIGADIIKICYSGDPQSFRNVAETCYRPIVVLGGSKQDPDQLIASSKAALAAGAKGVAIGRNIWQAKNPAVISAKLATAVHG